MPSLALLEDFAFEHTNQVAALFLVQHDHHIGAQAEDSSNTASQEEHNPPVNGQNSPNYPADTDNHRAGQHRLKHLGIENIPFQAQEMGTGRQYKC